MVLTLLNINGNILSFFLFYDGLYLYHEGLHLWHDGLYSWHDREYSHWSYHCFFRDRLFYDIRCYSPPSSSNSSGASFVALSDVEAVSSIILKPAARVVIFSIAATIDSIVA